MSADKLNSQPYLLSPTQTPGLSDTGGISLAMKDTDQFKISKVQLGENRLSRTGGRDVRWGNDHNATILRDDIAPEAWKLNLNILGIWS